MKIEKIDNNKLKITLSCMEILQMNLDIHPSESSNSFLKLLNSLEADYQFSVLNQKVILEMIPGEQEGCSIYITTTCSEKKKAVRKSNQLLIFSFVQFDMMLYACSLIHEKFNGNASVYRLDQLYYLVLYFESTDHLKTIRIILSDLSDTLPKPLLFESVLEEYGTLLCQSESLALFLEYEKNDIFSKK